MKISRNQNQAGKGGYALLVTLTFLGIMLTVFASIMYYILSNAKLTKRNNQYVASEAAAEAATEKVLSQMNHDFQFGNLNNSSTNATYYATSFLPTTNETSWPIQYSYSGTNTSTNQQISVVFGPWASNAVPLNSQYTGLQGFEQDVTLIATATPTTGTAVPSTVTETVQFALIPLFQFAIFYNMNLEIAAAQPLGIQGAVYSNGGIWSGSSNVTFSNTVSAVGLATNSANDPFCLGYSGSGLATYRMAGQPTSGNDTLTLPIGTNNTAGSVEAIINIPPTNYMFGTSSMYSTNGQLYLANEADLFLTNYPSGTNWNGATPLGAPMALYYNSMYQSNYIAWVTNDFYIVSNWNGSAHIGLYNTNYVSFPTNYASGFNVANGFFFTNGMTPIRWTNNPPGTNYVLYMGYSFLTNVTFVDWREGYHGGSGPAKKVQAVQFNMTAFNTWLTNSGASTAASRSIYGGSNYNAWCSSPSTKNHPIDSIYIYNAVPLTSTVLPAARVVNGAMMPPDDGTLGFTLSTVNPLYVWGDYNCSNRLGSSISQNNCVYTEPAALLADAVTVLSDGWSDSNTGLRPTAQNTTINAACLEGIVESNTNNAASDASGYSGGVENFLRLVESWSSATLYYNGSIIVMFPSIYGTNCWQQTGGYYNAPTRKWAFDTNFNIGSDLPPLTPKSYGVIRGTWNAN